MNRIVYGITSLQQHREVLRTTPEVYRPAACPHCGLGRLCGHGCYSRKDQTRPSPERRELIAIPRFRCSGCKKTCSRLPMCVAARRWYDWAVQQRAVQLLLLAYSLNGCSAAMDLDRRTVRRWWEWLTESSQTFMFWLRSRFPELGRAPDWKAFWTTWLSRKSLAEAMYWLDREVIIP